MKKCRSEKVKVELKVKNGELDNIALPHRFGE